MSQGQYVSTDPKAGQPTRNSDYISTDPNAGTPLRVNSRGQKAEQDALSFRGATGIGRGEPASLEALPTMGGMVGSLVGGSKSNPVGMLLAATGGATGEAWRQVAAAIDGRWQDIPPDMQSQITAILGEGIKQGGLEGIGRYFMGPVLKVFGRSMYRSALKPPVAVRREFGGNEVAQTLVDAGVPITRSGRGAERVEQLLQNAGRDTADTIAAADAAGATPVPMRAVVKSLDKTRASVANRAVRTPALEQVKAFRDAALADNPALMSLTNAQAMKQAEQDLAINAYKAEMRGAPVNSLETSMHEDLARGLREAIERRIPSIADKNKRTQDLIGALKAITAAEGRIANNNLIGMGDFLALGTGATAAVTTGRPSAAALGILPEVFTRPEIASRLGIVFDRAGRPQVTPQVLRLVNEVVGQLSGGTDAVDYAADAVRTRTRGAGPRP